jgi:hypothetical protein
VSIASMPWAAGLLRYAYTLCRPAKGSERAAPSKKILRGS